MGSNAGAGIVGGALETAGTVGVVAGGMSAAGGALGVLVAFDASAGREGGDVGGRAVNGGNKGENTGGGEGSNGTDEVLRLGVSASVAFCTSLGAVWGARESSGKGGVGGLNMEGLIEVWPDADAFELAGGGDGSQRADGE